MAFWKYLNPLYPLIRAKQDVGSSLKGIYTSVSAMRERSRGASEAAQPDAPEVAKQRFEAAYKSGGWSESELALQIAGVRRARRFFIIFGYVAVPCMIAVSLYMPWWMTFFIAMAAMVCFVLMVSLSAKHAWWAWQLEGRSFGSFKEFASLPDFVARVLIP